MSDLLNSASLVMIPSGYKEDVVYSQIPTSGAGDLSFTRASNGTRVNSAGLVEVCPWNLVQNSENFDAIWTKYNGATVTVDAISAPNGTTTADLLIAGANQEVYSANMPKVAEELYYTFSCYAKLYNTNVFKMTASDFSTSGVDASFNLSTITATYVTGATWSNSSASIESVGNGWYRCILTSKSPATAGLYLSLYTSGTNSVSGAYIWGAQVNIGATAKPYFPTTDRLNVPRLTYQKGGGGCPSLLLEKQSTNLVTYSEDFSNAVYTKRNSTIGSNVTTSPDGTTNADKIQEDTSNNRHDIYTDFTCTNGVTYTQTIFAKQGERRYCFMSFGTAILNAGDSFFDLQDGVVVSSPSGVTSSIENMGNGWYRCRITTTCSSNGTGYFVNGPANTSSNYIYQGVSGYGIYIWGVQIEQSSYPTSYIPTTSSSATRVADVYSRSLSSIASGTAFINITDNVAVGTPGTHLYGPFSITGASLGLHLSRPNNARLRLWTQASANVFQTTETNLKLAMTWDGTNVNVYQNGVKVVTNYAYALTNVNSLSSSTNLESSATIAEIVLFNSVLTDAEAIALTTI